MVQNLHHTWLRKVMLINDRYDDDHYFRELIKQNL